MRKESSRYLRRVGWKLHCPIAPTAEAESLNLIEGATRS